MVFTELLPIYIIITFVFGLLSLKMNNSVNSYLLIILMVNALTEILSIFLLYKECSIKLSTTFNVIITNFLWLLLINSWIESRKIAITLLSLFLLFSIINLFFIQGFDVFNMHTFIVGAFIYIIVFVIKSFYELRTENFSLLLSNYYILLISPILYFFGFSFIFGFGNIPLAKVKILDIKLYDFIGYFVNIIYYTLINIYIFREKKLKHAG
jgi:hypothetical protein